MMRLVLLALIVAAGLAACGGDAETPEPADVALVPETPMPPNLLQTQTDALQKAKDMQAQMEQAEKQRQKELDAMTGN